MKKSHFVFSICLVFLLLLTIACESNTPRPFPPPPSGQPYQESEPSPEPQPASSLPEMLSPKPPPATIPEPSTEQAPIPALESTPTPAPESVPPPAKEDNFTLNISISPSGAGSVSPADGKYKSDTEIALTATPNSGYAFSRWQGDASGSSDTVSIIMNSDKTIIAYFHSVDIDPPQISNIDITGTTESTTTISWATDEPATSQIEYGLTTNYGFISNLDEGLITNHSIDLNNLESNTTYHFRARSTDEAGNEAVSGDYTFTTNQLATVIGGTINSDTTWTAANSPYLVTASVVVSSGVTLTIEPSVVVRLMSGKGIQIDGELIAQGTESEPIVFTSNQPSPVPGDWVNIRFMDSSIDAHYDGTGNYVSGSMMQYCTIQYGGGSNVAALKIESSSPLIDHCDISNNAVGGIYIDEGSPKINANEISANSKGSGVHVQHGTVTIIGNTITNNSAIWGGGINIGWATATVSNNTIIGNSADHDGGGISTVGTVLIDGNTIQDNVASRNGGGIHIHGGEVTVSNNVINANTSGWSGGGIYENNGEHRITDNIITDNSADAGGGISVSKGFISGNSISGNSANNGGGISAWDSATIRNNTIISNTASSEGGGIFCGPASQTTVLIEDNEISDNSGSGITVHGQLTSVSPATIHGNNIYSNEPFNIVNKSKTDIPNVDATGNWWGTTIEAELQDKIYDWFDDAGLAHVDFIPFLSAPN